MRVISCRNEGYEKSDRYDKIRTVFQNVNREEVLSVMTTTEQAKLLAQIMKEDLDRIRKMPPDERKAYCRESLQSIGILDQDGNVAEGYRRAFVSNAK